LTLPAKGYRILRLNPARHILRIVAIALACSAGVLTLLATPANKNAFERRYDTFLGSNLKSCSTCHLPGHPRNPESLDEIPHNPFGARLREVRKEIASKDLDLRLARIGKEDSDVDGVPNELELLLGTNPGDPKDVPNSERRSKAAALEKEFAAFLKSYKWRPFQTVQRPEPPKVANKKWVRNPIDAFVAAEHEKRGLKPRPEASKATLLRRVYMDLIGLAPTPSEQLAFEADSSPKAYEKVVDRLLKDPRYGERWGRHWMDVWRYSDWAGWSGGNQIRDSKPHIWRWRDWIVESLNDDKGYDQMVTEMLAADELAPGDTNALRATGFLARNYKMLSREQWLEDTVKHTSQAFLAVTVGCAKCHDHMHDPVSQMEYYQMRAIFEPHQVRTDKVPGELDTFKAGFLRVYDVDTNPPTYFLKRGDERMPDTNRVAAPGVPRSLSGDKLSAALEIVPVSLPQVTAFPDKRSFVIEALIAAATKAVTDAEKSLTDSKTNQNERLVAEREIELEIQRAKHAALLAVVKAERLEDEGLKETAAWKDAATEAVVKQRALTICEAQLEEHKARGKFEEADAAHRKATEKPDPKEALEKAEKQLAEARKKLQDQQGALAKAREAAKTVAGTEYKPRPMETYPAFSTGRRLAFARWVTDEANPLTARVAMNHIWLRRFGRGIVNTPSDFGGNGVKPSHPALLDWLAAEFMARGWSMKEMHRLMVTSSAYRMASTPDEANLAADPDNVYLWRMPSRRIEAEVVRDNLLWTAGTLDRTMGGPEIPHTEGLSSKRRSVYLRIAAEKEVEFLKLFDGPSVNECYRRHATVLPQQALALANSELALKEARELASALQKEAASDAEFVNLAYRKMLARPPAADELKLCLEFLQQPKPGAAKGSRRDNLILVLFNHNDFLTVR